MCRHPVTKEKLSYLDLEKAAPEEGTQVQPRPAKEVDPLVQLYGTKPAAVTKFLQKTLAADGENKIIVFSQWHQMLKLMGTTLKKNKIPFAWAPNADNSDDREKALEEFRSGEKRVLMLSLAHSASGTNLQMANHVVMVEPPGENKAHALATETQAIGRTLRIGQTRQVHVTYFLMEGTIEEDVYGALFAARQTADQASSQESRGERSASRQEQERVAAGGQPDEAKAPREAEAAGVSSPSASQRPSVPDNSRPAKRAKQAKRQTKWDDEDDDDDECIITKVIGTPSAGAMPRQAATNPRERQQPGGSGNVRASPQPMQPPPPPEEAAAGDSTGTKACPICGRKDLTGMGNAEINQHIDSCLSGFA